MQSSSTIARGSPDVTDLTRELLSLRAEIDRERFARQLRTELNDLIARTSAETTRAGIARVIAEGATAIFTTGFVHVAFVEQRSDSTATPMVHIAHGASVPENIVAGWSTHLLSQSAPLCDVLRGEVPRLELTSREQLDAWPSVAAAVDRANVQALSVHPIGAPGRPEASIAIAWREPRGLDDLERELLGLLLLAAASAFARAVQTESNTLVARELQNWLLDIEFDNIDGVDMVTLYEPAHGTNFFGGDWHDVVSISPTRTAVVIGDVVGHDIRAAVGMSQVRQILSTNLRILEDPVEALAMTDAYLRFRTPRPMATALVMVLEPDDTITIASAGHPPPIVWKPGDEAVVAECGLGAPLGSGLGTYTSRTIPFGPGSLLTCFTDGVVETRADDIDECVERLRSDISWTLAVSQNDEAADPYRQIHAVCEMLRRRVDTAWRTDDAAAAVLVRTASHLTTPPTGTPTELSHPLRPSGRTPHPESGHQ